MKRIASLLGLRWLGAGLLLVSRSGSHPLFLLAILRSELVPELVGLEHAPDLDLTFLEGSPLHPLDRLVHRLRLNEPKTGDELLGLGERSIDHGRLLPIEPDACPL